MQLGDVVIGDNDGLRTARELFQFGPGAGKNARLDADSVRNVGQIYRNVGHLYIVREPERKMQNDECRMQNEEGLHSNPPSRCLRCSEDPDSSRAPSGSSEYLRHRRGRLHLLSLRSAFCILHSAFLLLAAAAPDPSTIAAPTTQPADAYVRFDEDGHGGGNMQVAVGTYVNDDGVQVELLSTMHIGETAFFRTLARQFPKYDAVLYELVAPRGVPPTEEGVNDQQKRAAKDCGLENQGPHVNYDRPNFVHADLSLEEIKQLITQKSGTFKGALGDGPGLKAARDERDTAGKREIFADLKAAETAAPAECTRLLRRAYSRQLAITAQPAPGKTVPEGEGMDVLVTARNDEVIRVLKQQIESGKKNLAIFYGAAHMVDLEHRLFNMGFKRQSLRWQTVWTVAPDGTPTTQAARAKH